VYITIEKGVICVNSKSADGKTARVHIEPPPRTVTTDDLEHLKDYTNLAWVLVLATLAIRRLAIMGELGAYSTGSIPETIATITTVFLLYIYAFIWSVIGIRFWYQALKESVVSRNLRIVATVSCIALGITPLYELFRDPLHHIRNIATSILPSIVAAGIIFCKVAGLVMLIRIMSRVNIDYSNWQAYNEQRYQIGEPSITFQDLYGRTTQEAFDR